MEQNNTHQHPPQDEGKLKSQTDYPLPPGEKSDKHFQPSGPGSAVTKPSVNSTSGTNYQHMDMNNSYQSMDSVSMSTPADQYSGGVHGSQVPMPPGPGMPPGPAIAGYDNGVHRPAMFGDMKTPTSSSNPSMLGPPSYNQGGGPGAMTMNQQPGSTPTLNQLLTQNSHPQKYPPSSYPGSSSDYSNSNMPGMVSASQPMMYDGWSGHSRSPQSMYPGSHMRPAAASPRAAPPNQMQVLLTYQHCLHTVAFTCH